MDVYAVIDEVEALLKERGKASYRSLKLQFKIDDEYLEAIKEDLIEVRELAIDKDGRMLIWNGDATAASEPAVAPSPPPASYTPTHLAERILAEQAAMAGRADSDGERKTITALFADLKGSTALIEGLDPEEARAIIDPALQLMMDAVHRYDGYVAQALGDGIFALFGAPIACEDHPQRALYAALRMQDEMRRYSDRLRLSGGAPLLMRIGINTGEVVVRSIRKDDLHTDYVPVGHSTNIAARMQEMATPGSILVTEQTQKLTEGYFDLKTLGKAQVKGMDAALEVFEVLGAGPLRTKLQVAARRGLSRFVGRQREIDQMAQALDQAKDGHGQIVGVMGEPGLGKSRLFYEFKLTSQSGCLVLEAFSVSHGKASPYLPIIELLRGYFEIALEDGERKRREKVTGKVLSLDRSLEETLPYLFALLGIEDATASLQQMDPRIRRQRTFEALKKLFLRESLNQPLIVVFEDLHWIDDESQGFLETLSESVAGAGVLLLVNYRPEYRHDWGGKTYYTQLRLTPLGRAEAEDLLAFLLGNDASLGALKERILERTEGTPFFMEEVVQTLTEEGVLLGDRGHYRIEKTPDELHISPTVQGVLAARIDRLTPDEKHLLQHLAVIGREFPLGLVRKVVAEPEDVLYQLLTSLQAKEFLYEQPALAEIEYIFKHALTQEVAYGTVLQEQRKILHEETGQAIEALYGATLEDHYGELAHHYTRGGNTLKAIEYLHLAGRQAMQRSANDEAIRHLTQALELLDILDDTPARAEQELPLQMALGAAQIVTKGHGAPEVGVAYARADALCRRLGDRPEVIDVLLGLWVFHLVGASELKTAHEIAEQLLQLAQDQNDPTTLLKAHVAMLASLFYQGEPVAAREHWDQCIDLYDTGQHHKSTVLIVEVRLGVLAHYLAAWTLWSLGYPEQAVASGNAAVALAQELAHPYSTAWASIYAAVVHRWCGELQTSRDHAEAAAKLSDEHGFTVIEGFATILHRAALAGLGEREDHTREAGDALAIVRDAGLQIWMPYFLTAMAEIHGEAGQSDHALSVLGEAVEITTRWYEAEPYRLEGEMTLEQGGEHPEPSLQQKAEECFQKALEVARGQSAKSWELRAATSLARLWRRQGKHDEARELLSEVYDWFTEGFDTKDLQDAKALLTQLEQAA